MPPVIPNTKLAYAIESLKLNSSKTDKKLSPDVTDSFEQLNSVATLLQVASAISNLSLECAIDISQHQENSKLWPAAFQQLSSLLRKSLLPLYKASLASTLQYSIAIFTVINDERISPATKAHDSATKGAWEAVQTSLLSGILDFLDERPTYDHRTIVAAAIYPPLCTVCNSKNTSAYIPFGSVILHTVYQLLSETVTAHLVNQRKLRGPDYLGGKQLGVIIAQTRDYLVLESLLELFAKLLPSTKSKGGREKRTKFIEEVFNLSTLSCSPNIVGILQSISSTDWEHTSTKIIDALAKDDITFPQPFETTYFQIRGSKSYSVNRLYIDHTGFVANIDESGELETFRAPYSAIKSIKASALSATQSRIILLFLAPPVVGHTTITPPLDGEISVSFDIKNNDMAMFVRSLNTRGLKDIIAKSERKVSKPVAHLDLDFDKGDAPISTQDKVQNIERLWNEVLPTSPLFVPDSHNPRLQSQVLSPQNIDSFRDSTPLKCLTSDTETNLDNNIYPSFSEKITIFDSADEERAPKRIRATRPIITSDNETEVDFSTTLQRTGKSELPQQGGGPTKAGSRDASRSRPNSMVGRKRTSNETGKEAEKLPPKRSRRYKETYPPDRRPLASKKYGKKGRVSSPAPTHEIDFDELPAPSTDQRVRNHSDRLQSKISAIKRNGDKHPPEVEQIVAPLAIHVKEKQKESPASPQVTREEKLIAQIISDDEKPPRHSARVGNVNGRVKNVNPTSIVITTPDGRNVLHEAPEVSHVTQTDKAMSSGKPQKLPSHEGRLSSAKIHLHKKSQITPRTAKKAVVASSEHPPSIPLSNNQLCDGVLSEKNPNYIEEPDMTLTLASPARDAHVPARRVYSELIKAGSTSHNTSVSASDVVMIDLTEDSPKLDSKPTLKIDNPRRGTPLIDNLVDVSSERLRPRLKLPIPSSTIHIVSPRPLAPHVALGLNRTYRDHTPSSRPKGQTHFPQRINPTPPTFFPSPLNQNLQYIRRPVYNSTPPDKIDRAKKYELNPTSRVVETIGKITEVIVQNTSKRFDNVRKELRAGQISILLETANDLEKMRIEGVDHFNNLVDLEAEYARHRRRIIDGFEDLAKTSQDATEGLTAIIQEHDRNSLSRKFSDALFSSPLPSVLLNPKLVI